MSVTTVNTASTDQRPRATDTGTHAAPARRPVQITQYSRRKIIAVWAAAAVPMGLLSWVVAPAIAHHGSTNLTRALIVCLTAGLFWQFAMVAGLVYSEQRTLRWSRVRDAL